MINEKNIEMNEFLFLVVEKQTQWITCEEQLTSSWKIKRIFFQLFGKWNEKLINCHQSLK